MINRLAKGAAIAFNQLKVNHLIKISKNVIKHSNTSMSDIRINWGDGFEYCYMKMLAPNITSRRIGSELSKISSKILTTISDSLPETDRGLIIKVDFNDHDDIVKDRSLLLVDDDERVLKALKLTHKRTKFNLVDNVSDAVFKLKNLTPSAILLDIQILGDSLNLIHKSIDIIVDANSTVPIFLYKIGKPNSALISLEENENVRKVFFINDSGLENSGDIPPWISEGLMDVYSDSREIVLKETTKLINSVFYTIKNEEEINKLIRLNERISYSLSSDSESPFMVNINLDNPTQIISSEDSSKAMFGREIPKERLVDIVGLDRAKERVQQVIECLGKPELFTDKSVRPPTGYLIAGMPGTGKTMLARAVAGECELPFFTLSVAEIVDSGDGGPVAKIRELFEMARKYAPSIIFLDEIDAYAGKRGIGGNPVIVNTLLTEMDGFSKSDLPVFILAATNFPEKLDNALVRSGRFDEIIQCDHPNYEARVKLLNKLFTTSKQETQLSSNDMKTIATTSVGMTAAQLDQIHREAIYKYRATQLVVKLDDIQEIIYRVRYGSPSESTELTLEAKWETAYHESGHLIMRKLLMPESKIDYVTIEPRDMALGFVAHLPDEQYSSTTLKSLKNTVCVLLAGREAEKQYAGSFEGISTGASGDLRASTNLIYYAVCNGGLGEGLPPISVEVAKRYIDSKFSDYEQVTKSIVFECEKRTEKLLKDNYEIHEKFSKYLFEKESLINSEISEFFEGVEFKENS
jgi:ATP-dependent Zn protease